MVPTPKRPKTQPTMTTSSSIGLPIASRLNLGKCRQRVWALLAMLAMVACLVVPAASARESAHEPAKAPPTDYALIAGTVWGLDNLPAYGIKLTIRKVGVSKAHWKLTSDHRGEFAQRVPPGKADYIISATPSVRAKGLRKGLDLVEVTVHVEKDERVDTAVHLTQ